MLKKLLIATAILAMSSTAAFAACGPYVGASIGLNDLLTKTTIDSPSTALTTRHGTRAGLFNVFGGYGMPVGQNIWLGGEGFVNYASTNADQLTLTAAPGGSVTVNTRSRLSYGVSVLPGVMLSDRTMAYARLGVVRTNFQSTATLSAGGVSSSESRSRNLNGYQAGLGLQTALTPCLDLRGEYVYTGYRSYSSNSVKVTPSSDQFNVGLVYKFD